MSCHLEALVCNHGLFEKIQLNIYAGSGVISYDAAICIDGSGAKNCRNSNINTNNLNLSGFALFITLSGPFDSFQKPIT